MGILGNSETEKDKLLTKITKLQKKVSLLEKREKEYKKSIKALKESEQHYKQFFDALPYGGEIIDLNGFIVDCSKSTAKMLGYTKEELIGKHITQFVNDVTVKRYRENFPKLLKGESLFLKSTMIHKNGTPIRVIRAGEPIRDSNGKITGMLGLSMEITTLEKAEE